MNYKKAQIATSITWIPAFALIAFIMVIFLAITFTVSAAKSIDTLDFLTSYGKNEISLSGERINSNDYLLRREILFLINQKSRYKGNDARISDIIRQYSSSHNEDDFEIIRSSLKNRLDVLYKECYSLCLTNRDNTNDIKQIIGGKCNDLQYSCVNSNDPYLVRNYNFGQFIDSEHKYEIKLYVKNKDE